MISKKFLLAVITAEATWAGEEDCLCAMLEAGVEKLHIRKREGAEALLKRLALRWGSRLVLHGGMEAVELARAYGVPQVHGHWHKPWEGMGGNDAGPGGRRILLSASLHSWEEVRAVVPGRLEYVFLSPLFDSISKPGYRAGEGLLRRPEGVAPCGLIGLGGIDKDTIGQVIEHGWDGAAVLGAIWEKPSEAVERFLHLKGMVEGYER
ncbi:thiamine phosphate synthase [Flavitalea sp. BT771]|uniref:thiamine phosphate synthase n=1 Tax=Flavitalea sp. BT771 TaxID=3063329 RepID=UPI0026E35CD3|nr:thiamine phosphate synthase [Flavitalea sp. BT771]MDO6435035.1 thiamine phosphate synthase [Flavitalea sp. BT771]MDV6223935.1 thiamine phosphate synthase [Flavitalea sp. BT771]